MLSSTGSGPGYDSVFSVVLMRTLQRSDAGCKSPPPPTINPHSVSVSGPYLDVRGYCEIVQFVITTHVIMDGVVFLSVVFSVFVQWLFLLSCSALFSTNVLHLVCGLV